MLLVLSSLASGWKYPLVSSFLSDVGGQVLGPILSVVGLLMLFIDRISWGTGTGRLASLGNKAAGWGMVRGFLLGVIFALTFYPYSAVLFFGALIPIALNSSGGIVLPVVYAIGTGLPVLIFGTLLSLGITGVTSWLNTMARAEPIIRIIVSLTFVGVGVYYVVLWIQS